MKKFFAWVMVVAMLVTMMPVMDVHQHAHAETSLVCTTLLIVILSLMRASSAADKHAERLFPQRQADQRELEQQKQE